MEAKEPIGVTCHNERDKDGQWWIVWGVDFPGDKSGRREHPESAFLEDAYRLGIREVVEWIQYNLPDYEFGDEWQSKLKDWGIE